VFNTCLWDQVWVEPETLDLGASGRPAGWLEEVSDWLEPTPNTSTSFGLTQSSSPAPFFSPKGDVQVQQQRGRTAIHAWILSDDAQHIALSRGGLWDCRGAFLIDLLAVLWLSN
jgi:hypothetical protein